MRILINFTKAFFNCCILAYRSTKQYCKFQLAMLKLRLNLVRAYLKHKPTNSQLLKWCINLHRYTQHR